MTAAPLPGFEDVIDAARLLRGHAVVTPLLNAAPLDEELGCRLFVKAECLQRMGAFKFRGAYNAIARLAPAERRRGIVAYSSGNHAQGVAAAARLLDAPAAIVMPKDAPAIKIARTEACGAEVILYDRHGESREAIGARLQDERGLVLVPPFDHFHVIAGQGTVGNEIADQCAERGAMPDAVLVPCGGGGLAAGIGLALRAKCPETALHTVEPEAYDDTRRSLAAGERLAVAGTPATLCDALMSPMPGALTFALNRIAVARGLAVSEAAVKRAMRVAFEQFKLVLEPGGAVALAAVLEGAIPVRGKTVVAVCSGGNVDPALFATILAGG
jgi:threonine dehydratase